MDHNYELANYDRMKNNIHDKQKLLKPVSYYASIRPINYQREEAARAEAEAARAAKKAATAG
jgi:NADH-quinone oxidoreductase subunit I